MDSGVCRNIYITYKHTLAWLRLVGRLVGRFVCRFVGGVGEDNYIQNILIDIPIPRSQMEGVNWGVGGGRAL